MPGVWDPFCEESASLPANRFEPTRPPWVGLPTAHYPLPTDQSTIPAEKPSASSSGVVVTTVVATVTFACSSPSTTSAP